jgi:hypothetical protein
MQGSCSRRVAKRGALRSLSWVYSFEVDSIALVSRSDETNVCISCSVQDGSVHDGVPYEVISAGGRQLLNSDAFPTQSKAVMSPD